MEAIRLWESGLNQPEVARRGRVVRQTVVRWVAQYRERGEAALRKAGRAGRKPLLSQKDRQHLEELLARSGGAGLRNPAVDLPAGRAFDRAGVRNSLSRRPRLERAGER